MIIDLVDTLADRVIQLLLYRKQARKTLLDDHITPVFEEFEAVHNAYLAAFDKYRTLILNAKELKASSPILTTIEKDNLFTANQRAKVFELAKAAEDELVGPFVESIYRYLIDARVVDPLSNYEEPDIIFTQRWRHSLMEQLSIIFEGDWETQFEAGTHRPPYTEEEKRQKMEEKLAQFKIPQGDSRKTEKLKTALALEALDQIVHDMQLQYQKVSAEYFRLKKSLNS